MLECWLTYRLHLTTSLTSRHDLAISLRYKHPVWKRMHGISEKQRCDCRDMAQRARSRCQFLAARPHGVLHWHHHISTVCVDLSSSPEFRENVYESCSAIQCVLMFCSVNNCLPSNTTNQSTMLTNSWRASSRHPHIPTLSRSVGRVFEWCILASALFILVSSLLSEFLCTPLSIHSFDS